MTLNDDENDTEMVRERSDSFSSVVATTCPSPKNVKKS